MRRIRYSVVVSLDRCLACPNGEADWIVPNPNIDLTEIFSQFDTLLIGARTFEFMPRRGQSEKNPQRHPARRRRRTLPDDFHRPVLLGAGIPLLPPAPQTKLKLTGQKVYKTGIVTLE